MPHLNWRPAKLAAPGWGTKHLTKLTVRGVNLDSEFGATVLSCLPELAELEFDGPARNLKDAATTW
jgi:hypothetical protein